MKNRVLVETTIWIEFFRGRSKVAQQLEILLMENAVWTCGVVMFEVLQGIKSEGEKNKILSILSTLPYVEMTKKLWQSAAGLSILVRKNDMNLPYPIFSLPLLPLKMISPSIPSITTSPKFPI